MTELTRRHLFSTVAGLGAAAAFCPINATQAAAPPVGKQNAGFYRYKVGDIEVTVVTDGANTFSSPTPTCSTRRATISTRRSRRRISRRT